MAPVVEVSAANVSLADHPVRPQRVSVSSAISNADRRIKKSRANNLNPAIRTIEFLALRHFCAKPDIDRKWRVCVFVFEFVQVSMTVVDAIRIAVLNEMAYLWVLFWSLFCKPMNKYSFYYHQSSCGFTRMWRVLNIFEFHGYLQIVSIIIEARKFQYKLFWIKN